MEQFCLHCLALAIGILPQPDVSVVWLLSLSTRGSLCQRCSGFFFFSFFKVILSFCTPKPPTPTTTTTHSSCLLRLLFFVQGREGEIEGESKGKVKWVNACVWKCQTGDGKLFFLIVNGLLCLSSPFMSSPHLSSTFLPLLLSVPSQDYQRGIFQSIGFKEFHDYLTAPECSTRQEKDALRDKGERNHSKERLIDLDLPLGKLSWSQFTYLYAASSSSLIVFLFMSCRYWSFEDRNEAIRTQTE